MPRITSPTEPESTRLADNITSAVQGLKHERDTWKAIAVQYKAAFDTQTTRLHELQDICTATQAELENERTSNLRQQQSELIKGQKKSPDNVDGARDHQYGPGLGTAIVYGNTQIDGKEHSTVKSCLNLCFRRVEQFMEQRNYGTALVETERLLRGPLPSTARADGLLLKSKIYCALGPDCLYDALAACSEALELCDRLSELASFLPKVQFQRGVCYYQLRMLQQAQEAFNAAGDNASEYRRSCEDELEALRYASRRSGFEEHRTAMEDLLAQMEIQHSSSKRRRVSAQLHWIPIAKGKRLSLPKRWVSGSTFS